MNHHIGMRTAPHPFTLRQLQYVVAVADHLSFRAAAAAVHVSQPSLSAQLQEVEAQLGVVLFDRDKRRVQPTTAGERFVVEARALLASADRLASHHRADLLSGPLRIGVLPTVAPGVVGVVGKALRARFPSLTLRWREAQTAVLEAELERGAVDIALLARGGEGTTRSGDAVVATDEFYVACASRHALAAAEHVEAAALGEHRLLLLQEGHCLRDHALAACQLDDHLDHDFTATSIETLLAVVSDGEGITLLPRMLAPLLQHRSDLVLRPLVTPVARTLVLHAHGARPPDAGLVEVVRNALRNVTATLAPGIG